MMVSLYLGRFFALYLIVLGFLYLCRRELFSKVLLEIFDSYGFICILGFLNLIFGLLIILAHNVWAFNWTLIVTLLGYYVLIKGIVYLFFPPYPDKKKLAKFSKGSTRISVGVICLVLGLYLTVMTFFS